MTLQEAIDSGKPFRPRGVDWPFRSVIEYEIYHIFIPFSWIFDEWDTQQSWKEYYERHGDF